MKRALMGLVLAAAALPLTIAACVGLIGAGSVVGTTQVALSFALYTFATSLMLGLPAAWPYRLLGWNRLWQVALGGVAIGLLVSVYGHHGLRTSIAVVALVFWVAGMRGIPWFDAPAPLPE